MRTCARAAAARPTTTISRAATAPRTRSCPTAGCAGTRSQTGPRTRRRAAATTSATGGRRTGGASGRGGGGALPPQPRLLAVGELVGRRTGRALARRRRALVERPAAADLRRAPGGRHIARGGP